MYSRVLVGIIINSFENTLIRPYTTVKTEVVKRTRSCHELSVWDQQLAQPRDIVVLSSHSAFVGGYAVNGHTSGDQNSDWRVHPIVAIAWLIIGQLKVNSAHDHVAMGRFRPTQVMY